MRDDLPARLAQTLEHLPDQPGCYLHRAADGEVLYVGKARSLRSRVVSGLVNLPPLGVLGYTLLRWLWAFATGSTLPAGWFSAGFLITVAVLFVVGLLFSGPPGA